MTRRLPADYGLFHTAFRPHQRESIDWCIATKGIGIVEAPTGCHRAGQQILMWNGTTKAVEHIMVSDTLMGPDSRPRHVLNLCRGIGRMFEIRPVKGTPFVVNGNHMLTLVRTNRQKRGAITRKDCLDGEIVDVPVVDYLEWTKYRRHIYKLFRTGVSFWNDMDISLEIDPYFLGVLLGDGSFLSSTSVVTMEPEIREEVERQAAEHGLGIRINENEKCGNAQNLWLVGSSGKRHFFSHYLNEYGLHGLSCSEKFVPFKYKHGSRKQRLQLIAGLLDTDGHLSRGSCFDYISKSSLLSNDLAFLCRSVGMAAYVRPCVKSSQRGTKGIYYRVSISGNVSEIPCRVPKKQAPPREQIKSVLHTGLSIVSLEQEEQFFGFTLDEDGRYLLSDFTVTHNSGKTSYPAAASSERNIIALVQTKSLQRHQYDSEYGFDAHYGRANFDCVHPKAKRGTKCDRCRYLDKGGMQKCPVSSQCKYLLSKNRAMNSRRASLNYAYWMTAKNWRRNFPPEMLFCDEAHNLSDVVLNWVGAEITAWDRKEWNLPDFPELDSTRGSGMLIKVESPVDGALKWLEEALIIMYNHQECLKGSLEPKVIDAADQLTRKIGNALSSLQACSDEWFIKSGREARIYRGNPEPGFVCRPLTARHHAPFYFTGSFDTVMMSATIGNHETFAEELGIDDYEFRAIPNQWPPESRPVYVLDVPKMGYVKGESDRKREMRFDKQADEIARFIKEWPSDWPGLVHVTRKAEERRLANRLACRGLQDRMWFVPGKEDRYIGTDYQLSMWNARLARIPNSILVTCSLGEGYDGKREKINISAKVPYPLVGRRGSYEYAWMTYSRSRYDQAAAIALAQQQGRNRRGRACDYDTPWQERGANAVADGSFERVLKRMPVGIQEAIVRA